MTQKTTISVAVAHDRLEKLLGGGNGEQAHMIVEREGEPVAVILSFEEYKTLTTARAWEVLDLLNEALGHEADAQGLTEADLQEDIKRHRHDIMRDRYGSLD